MPIVTPIQIAMIRPRVKLEFLDGLRGLAAFYVLLHHLYDPFGVPRALTYPLSILRFGHYAVGAFIVLSGYCLMLPIVRSTDGKISGGTFHFFKRRAMRILPPYYAALILSLVWLFSTRKLTDHLGISAPDTHWADNFTAGTIISHLLLVHNWSPVWNTLIDAPMWSVATEWQIYFLFPLLLLPVWHRFGNRCTILTGLIVGLGPLLLLPKAHNFSWACPQYLALFTFGMAGSVIGFSQKPELRKWQGRIPWGALSFLSILIFACIVFYFAIILGKGMGPLGLPVSQPWALDILVGFSTICLIIFCAKQSSGADTGEKALILKVLSSRFAIGLGAFSYSLYLTQLPIIIVSKLFLRHFVPSPTVGLVLMFCVVFPGIITFSYLFHLVFERPFISQSARFRLDDELKPLNAQN